MPSDPMREVLTPRRVRMLLALLLSEAIEQRSPRAIQRLLELALGKPRRAALPAAAIPLPDGLKSTADVAGAANGLLAAVAAGRLSPEDAQRAAMLVEVARRSIETQDLERRIADLEERAKRRRRD